MRESRAAASIDHPNVIPIYYAGEHDGLLYIAMRYVEGGDLRTLVRARGPARSPSAPRASWPRSPPRSTPRTRAASSTATSSPPTSCSAPSDHAYLTDFGLTKRLQSAAGGETHAGGWVGHARLRRAGADPRRARRRARRRLRAGLRPLPRADRRHARTTRDSDEATLWAHLNDPPPPVATVAGVPEAFDESSRRALAKDPAERYPSAGDLGRAALTAAGAPATIRPERTVAVGAAAPGGDEETVVSADQSPTHMATRRQETPPPAPGRPAPARPRAAWLLALIPVLALVIAGVLLLGGGGDDGTTTGDRTATTGGQDGVPAPAGRVVGQTPVGGRPNDLVVAAGSVWVLRGGNERLAILDARTGKRRSQSPLVGGLPASAAAGFGKLWVARQRDPALVAFGLSSRRRSGPEVPLGAGGDRAVAVAAGENAVFVGLRTRPGRVLRIDPRRRQVTKTIELEQGVQDLAVGAGAIWVTGRRADVVTRVDIRTAEQREFNVGRDPSAVAVGEDGVWVANRGDDTLTRIDTGSFNTETLPVGRVPAGVGVGGGAVWVANRVGNTVMRLDPRTGERVGRSVPCPATPTRSTCAAARSGSRAWGAAPSPGSKRPSRAG